jgi:uncharacterized protein YycO
MIKKFLQFIKPFTKWIAKIHWPFSRKLITGKDYYKWRDDINVGTVLLSSTYGELSNLFNPADIKHGAIYIGYIDGIPSVAEALGKGVTITDLVTFLTTKDRVVGLSPDFLEQDDKVFLTEEALKRVGIPYDYQFSSGNKALYCFELIVEVFKSTKPSVILNREEIVKGHFIYDEATFINDSRFIKLFDSKDATNE